MILYTSHVATLTGARCEMKRRSKIRQFWFITNNISGIFCRRQIFILLSTRVMLFIVEYIAFYCWYCRYDSVVVHHSVRRFAHYMHRIVEHSIVHVRKCVGTAHTHSALWIRWYLFSNHHTQQMQFLTVNQLHMNWTHTVHIVHISRKKRHRIYCSNQENWQIFPAQIGTHIFFNGRIPCNRNFDARRYHFDRHSDRTYFIPLEFSKFINILRFPHTCVCTVLCVTRCLCDVSYEQWAFSTMCNANERITWFFELFFSVVRQCKIALE